MVTGRDDQSRIFEAMETPSRRGTIVAIIRGSFASRSLYVRMAAVPEGPGVGMQEAAFRRRDAWPVLVYSSLLDRLQRGVAAVAEPVDVFVDLLVDNPPGHATTEGPGGWWRP